MPVDRTLVAAGSSTFLERVCARPHRADWGEVHDASGWRCILPGAGEVHWRSGGERLFVDAMTAFQLKPGERYQLLHERDRDHLVLCSASQHRPMQGHRAWLVPPRGLFELLKACRAVQRGDVALDTVARSAMNVLARSQRIDASAEPHVVLRARQLIARHACDELPLEALSEAVHCSPSHLTRMMGRHAGTTPHQYRLRLRLAHALRHLQAGERDLAALAHFLGFSSQSHFGEAFGRAIGCTPAQARAALA